MDSTAPQYKGISIEYRSILDLQCSYLSNNNWSEKYFPEMNDLIGVAGHLSHR